MSLILSVEEKNWKHYSTKTSIKYLGRKLPPAQNTYFNTGHIAVSPLAAKDFAASKYFCCFLCISDHDRRQISKWRRWVAQKFNEIWNCCNCSMWLRAQPLPVQSKPCADYSPTSSPLWVHTWSHTEVYHHFADKANFKTLKATEGWFLTVSASQILKSQTEQLQYSKKTQGFLLSSTFKSKCWPAPN